MLKWNVAGALLVAPAKSHARQAPAEFDWFEYKGDDRPPKPEPGGLVGAVFGLYAHDGAGK